MFKMTKFAAAALAVTVTASLFAGCGTKAEPEQAVKETAEVATADEKEQVNLRFAWWGGDDRHKATLEAIDKYMALNPHVKIEAEYGGYDGYQQKLITQLSGGTVADVVQVDQQWIAEFIKQGDLFTDLNTLGINTEGMEKEYLQQYAVYGDKLLGLPAGLNGLTIFYSKDFFKNFDIPEDTLWTWDKVLEYGKLVHEKDPEAYLMTAETGGLSRIVKSYIYQKYNREWVNPDYTLGVTKEELQDALEYIRLLRETNTLEPFEEFTLFDRKGQENPKFIDNKLGMNIIWVSILGSFLGVNENLGVAQHPLMEGKENSGIIVKPTAMYCIPSSSPNAEEAGKFLDWIMNDLEAGEILRDVRSVPAVAAVRNHITEKGLVNPLITDATNIALENVGFAANSVADNTEIDNWLREAIQMVGFGQATVEEATDTLVQRVEQTLGELKALEGK